MTTDMLVDRLVNEHDINRDIESLNNDVGYMRFGQLEPEARMVYTQATRSENKDRATYFRDHKPKKVYNNEMHAKQKFNKR
jgi:hypothetical protein